MMPSKSWAWLCTGWSLEKNKTLGYTLENSQSFHAHTPVELGAEKVHYSFIHGPHLRVSQHPWRQPG